MKMQFAANSLDLAGLVGKLVSLLPDLYGRKRLGWCRMGVKGFMIAFRQFAGLANGVDIFHIIDGIFGISSESAIFSRGLYAT
jgi:hypothetical protein